MPLFGGTPVFRFTRTDSGGDSPKIVAAAASDSDFEWEGPGGSFTGKQPDIGNFPAGDFQVRSAKWNTVTEMLFDSRKLSYFEPVARFSKLTALTKLTLNGNPALAFSLPSLWSVLPNTLTWFNCSGTLVYGDVSGMVMKPACNVFTIDGLHVAYPGPCLGRLEGSIAGWNITPIYYFSVRYHPLLSGDISNYVPSAGLVFAYFNSSPLLSYGTGGFWGKLTRNTSYYLFYACDLSTAELDRILAELVASGTTNGDIDLAGIPQSAPTDGKLNADRATLLSRGWTVTVKDPWEP
jgi:hypothetical protein